MRGGKLSALGWVIGALLACAAPSLAEAPLDAGAQVSVQVEPNGDSRIDVDRGEVAVKPKGGGATRVRAGESLRVPKGKAPKRLLVAPALLAPIDRATVATLEVPFSWSAVPGAARYMLEVSASPEVSGANMQTVAGTRSSMRLGAGNWYWRVVAFDGEGTPGRRGRMQQLTIDPTPPKLKTGKPQWR